MKGKKSRPKEKPIASAGELDQPIWVVACSQNVYGTNLTYSQAAELQDLNSAGCILTAQAAAKLRQK